MTNTNTNTNTNTLTAAAVFSTALTQARTVKTSAAYRMAAMWAGRAAAEASYECREQLWAQADELRAMAAALVADGR